MKSSVRNTYQCSNIIPKTFIPWDFDWKRYHLIIKMLLSDIVRLPSQMLTFKLTPNSFNAILFIMSHNPFYYQ